MKKTQWNLLKNSSKKTPELIKEFSKPVKYKTGEQISIISPYTRSEKSETGIFKILLQYKKKLLRDKPNKRCERKTYRLKITKHSLEK